MFFGNTIEDDYKSQLYLEQYLKDNKLNDKAKAIIDEIFKDNKESNDYKDFENIANNEPMRAWKILEEHGYDLDLQLVAFTSIEEAKNSKLSKQNFDKFANLIVLDI